MLQNVEYRTLPLNNAKFWQHFWAENVLKVPTFDSMQNISFSTRKYMWNVNENCEKAKKKKKKKKKMLNVG